MMDVLDMLLAQCPCSGGDARGSSLSYFEQWLVIATALGAFLLIAAILKSKGLPRMGKVGKVAIVVALAVAIVAVILMKQGKPAAPSTQPAAEAGVGLPRLVDLGSTTCIPCKMMAPVLEELGKEYAGRMQVEFINVDERPEAAKPYGIQMIPTQIFLDANGKELWRHEGFMAKEDILAKWQELGISFAGRPATTTQPASAPALSE